MKIVIVGLGLIGGSLGLAMKKAPQNAFQVIGIPRREETINLAKAMGAIDEGTIDLRQGVAGARIIFIATPISLIIPTLKKLVPFLKPGTIVTDVASAKQEIVKQAEKSMPKETYFVGGHPLAGKEQVKLEAAEAGLFQGRVYALTPTNRTNEKALLIIEKIISLIGARAVRLDPQTHDLAVAAISHLPLAAAASLVNAVRESKKGQEAMKQLAASGFRDTTRIASGDPLLGVDMFTANKQFVLQMLGDYKKALAGLEKKIKKGDAREIAKELEAAKKFRDGLAL